MTLGPTQDERGLKYFKLGETDEIIKRSLKLDPVTSRLPLPKRSQTIGRGNRRSSLPLKSEIMKSYSTDLDVGVASLFKILE